MKYLDAVAEIHKIEAEYDVMSIKYNGISIWPYFRIYIFDALSSNRAVGYSSSVLKTLLSSLFHYNPLRFFKKYDVWNYSSSTTRKKLGDYYEHHVSGGLYKGPYRVLTIEMQSPGIDKIRKKNIPERNIVSASWPLALTACIEILMRAFHQKLDGEEILKEIMTKLHVKVDYKKRLRWLISQKLITDFFLTIGHKPKLMMMVCYYTQMGQIWSAHNHKIPVVELQHGVLNANHYAYNPTYHSTLLYPDEICVYGEEEYKYFSEKEKQFATKVTMTGLYILDRSSEFFKRDIFEAERKKYKRICVVAGQAGGEEQLSSFIDKVANLTPDTLFVYIPRHVIELKFKSPNVILKVGVNIYEYLNWCDYHATISSTTALEAHYFKKPVVFCDFNDVAKEYYGSIIGNDNGAYYVHTLQEFVETIDGLVNQSFTFRELFAQNSEKRMQTVLDRYLKPISNEKVIS